jgi:uncharacterized protein (UPF0332 family)
VTVNATDNVLLAKIVHLPVSGAPVEASMRCACGRAYYAAFVIARDLLVSRFSLSTGSAHREVIDLLKRSKSSDVREAGLSLDRLRATRNSADYQVGIKPVAGRAFDKMRAALAIQQAEHIIGALQNAAKLDRWLQIPH